jgi:transcription elongation factor GreB
VSKAFTSEEAADLPPVVRPPPRLAPGEVRHVTPEGHAALRAAAEALRGRRAAASTLAPLERDLRAAEIEARLAALEATLAVLTVLGPERAPAGRVAFGTWVNVEDEAGRRATWRIVGPDESDPSRGLVGVESPLARALLGREVGDEVEVQRPAGKLRLTVREVHRTSP